MNLNAVSLGYAVPKGDFVAVIHSVFPEAVNLQPRKASRLLTLVTADCADLPQGIRLETLPDFSFDEKLHSGTRMECRSGTLVDVAGRISIDLSLAKRWKCLLPQIDMNVQPVAAAWKVVCDQLNEHQTRAGAQVRLEWILRADLSGQSAVSRKLFPLVHGMAGAARRFIRPAEDNVAGCIGLGPGLTPAGDDFLVGFLTGLSCTVGEIKERQMFLSELGKMVLHNAHQTNDISRTYLFHATRGQVSSLLRDLAEAISRGEKGSQLLTFAEEAMQVGHSSGMETVTGLLVGLSVWRNGTP